MNDIVPNIDTELDVIFGEYRDTNAVETFVKACRNASLTGTLYIGYPVLAIDDDKIEYDAILVSRNRGVVIFDLYSTTGGVLAADDKVVERMEKLYAALYNRLNSFSELRSGRQLAVSIQTATITPLASNFENVGDNLTVGLDRLAEVPQIPAPSRLDDTQIEHLNAAIQRISNLKPKKKREGVTNPDSMGSKIKEIEKRIANLDLWQKRGSIEYVNGPQRIRGLAGSGKTVVLALKAAYLHVKRPDWTIVVTFNTRSLYQQFEALITRFVYAQINEEPDWSKIKIMHAWGGSERSGVYREFTSLIGAPYRDFATAARLYGYETAFKGACDEAISYLQSRELEAYDMMLIDEAQDLPTSFFRIVHAMVKNPKRIVWAYDDLQNLGDAHLPSPKELFGTDAKGRPLVELSNQNDKPQQDIVLPRCYRNPPWTLVTAHGLGFGIHRDPMAQIFTDPKVWDRLGYSNEGGAIEFSSAVNIARKQESVPSFFHDYLTPEDTLTVAKFDGGESQYRWIAGEIKKLVSEGEMEFSDILIILPNVKTSKSEGSRLYQVLASEGIKAHIPGQTSSRDEVFREGSIAITHIHRAKGNEAPVVFVVNAGFCEGDYALKKRRNILFTAITRSRAWTYITGSGSGMDVIAAEVEKIRQDGYALKFVYPAKEQAEALAVTSDSIEGEDLVAAFDDLREALKRVRDEQLPLPIDLQEELAALSGGK